MCRASAVKGSGRCRAKRWPGRQIRGVTANETDPESIHPTSESADAVSLGNLRRALLRETALERIDVQVGERTPIATDECDPE